MKGSQAISKRGAVSTGKGVENSVDESFDMCFVDGNVSIVGDVGDEDSGADAAIVWWVQLLLGDCSGVLVGKVHGACFSEGADVGFAMGM